MHCKSSGQQLQWQDDSRKLDIPFDGTHDRYCYYISDFLKIDKASESAVEVTHVFY
jgi:hypothetical protein